MSRIDIAHINGDIRVLESGGEFDGCTSEFLLRILKALKRSYEREDELLDALRIIRNDLDDLPTGPNGDMFEHIRKIKNFANDASL